MNISILCPTRKRPASIERFIHNIKSTAYDPDSIEIISYVDNDDPESATKLAELKTKYSNISFKIGNRVKLSDVYNYMYPLTTADIFMICGDDVMIRTNDWDTIVLEEFNRSKDKIIFAYGNDPEGIMPITFGTQFFIHRNWAETIGYLTPPYFICDYCDTWFNEIADMINRKVLLPIHVEHLHFTNGKASFDETYRTRRAEFSNERPDLLFHSETMVTERKIHAKKLQAFIDNYEHTI